MGTGRLPLSRHACGKILWSFLDALGGPGVTPMAIVRRAEEDIGRQEEAMTV